MLENTNKNHDIKIYWQIFWRRKYFFIIPFVVSIIVGIALIVYTNPVYESSTVVRVNQSEMLSNARGRFVPGVTAKERVTNLRRIIKSHAYLKRLIVSLNLQNDQKMRTKAQKQKKKYSGHTIEEIVEIMWMERFKKDFTIKQLGTDFIQISVVAGSPNKAFDLVKTLTQIFIDESLENEMSGIQGAREFGDEQLKIYKKRLEESEEQLRNYKAGVMRDEIENYSIVSANLEQANTWLTTTDFELREAKDRLDFINYQLNKLEITYNPINNKLISILKKQILDRTLELSKLMLRYSWQDTKIMGINKEIEDLRRNIKSEIERIVKAQFMLSKNTNLNLIVEKEVATIDVYFLTRKKSALADLINIYKSSISKGPSREMTMNRLQREVDANREIYQYLMQQTQGSEIEEALQRTAAEFKFKIIEPALKPTKPIEPNPLELLLIALALGIGIGIGLIVVLEYTDHSFKNMEEVEKYINLPVLGVISKIEVTSKFKF